MYASGRLMAFNEVISIIRQTAVACGLDLRDLRLNDINPDRDLV
jgi:hypothetical protein